ncbi:MAG: hypothetical protein RLN96_11575 [Pseudomonadales bacterium]
MPMTLKTDLEGKVKEIYGTQWTRRNGQTVPDQDDLKLSNDAIDLSITILYADLTASTDLVDNYRDWYASENYKTFLHCATKIIRSHDGYIRSYDGDRVMGVFIGDMQNTRAVKVGLKINWAVKYIINPAKKAVYPSCEYVMKHVVGIDTSNVMAIRPGIRGSNDIAWIGRSANHAAKLSSMDASYPTWITDSVYNVLADEAKYSNGKHMWEARVWSSMNNRKIYRSNYWWPIV